MPSDKDIARIDKEIGVMANDFTKITTKLSDRLDDLKKELQALDNKVHEIKKAVFDAGVVVEEAERAAEKGTDNLEKNQKILVRNLELAFEGLERNLQRQIEDHEEIERLVNTERVKSEKNRQEALVALRNDIDEMKKREIDDRTQVDQWAKELEKVEADLKRRSKQG